MVFAGIAVTLLGFLLSLFSLVISSSTGGRLGIVLAGIVVSIIGIVGLINPAYVRNAIWKR